MSNTTRHCLILIGLCVLTWLPWLPVRTLWPNDEPRYALMARDMIESGEYIVPVNQGRIYHQKPPLFVWAEVLSSKLLGGVTETSVRIPSFLAATGGVLVAYSLASVLFGTGAALMSALILATNIRYMLSAQWAAPDMLMCFFITACLACFAHAYFGGRRWLYPAIYLLAGLGTLAKGPMGILFPAGTILLFLAFRRDLGEVRRMRPLSGLVILAATLAPWLLSFWYRAGTQEVADLLFKQTLVRYAHAWNNVQPWHFFLWTFPVEFFPWTIIALAGAVHSWSAMEKDRRILILSWFALVFIFFSASSGKRGVYILPLYPAAAMIGGWFIDRVTRGESPPRAGRWLKAGCVATGVVFIAAGLLIRPMSRGMELPGEAGTVIIVSSLTLVAAGAVIAILPPRWSSVAIAASVAVLNVVAITWGAPVENQRQNVRTFGHEIARLVPEGAPLAMVREHFEDLVFYSHRAPEVEIRRGPRLAAWLGRPETVYAVLNTRAYESLSQHSEPSWNLLASDKVAGEEFYLVTNR